jgi:hypothetical protein
MKLLNKFLFIILLMAFLVPAVVYGDTPPPPPPPPGSEGDQPPPGAPVGEGILLLLGLAGAWGARKYYLIYKRDLQGD